MVVVVMVVVVVLVVAQSTKRSDRAGSQVATSTESANLPSTSTSDPSVPMTSSAAPTPDPTPSPLLPSPIPMGPLGDEAAEQQRVEQSVLSVVDLGNDIAQRGDGVTDGIEVIATGFVLGELANLAREQSEQGLTQTGQARVVSSQVLSSDLESSPPTMTIQVCVDVSDLRLTDSQGRDVSERLYQPGFPVLHIYGAEFHDEVWKISSHEIPAEQSCEV